jgi:hypothetical protein
VPVRWVGLFKIRQPFLHSAAACAYQRPASAVGQASQQRARHCRQRVVFVFTVATAASTATATA